LRVDGYEDYARRLRSPQVRAKLNEAIQAGCPAARVTSRYFCLGGEPFVAQGEVGELCGIRSAALASSYVYGMLVYLGLYPGAAIPYWLPRIRGIEKRVDRYRRKRVAAVSKAERLQRLGLPEVPDVPAHLWPLLVEIRRARDDGRMDALDPRTRSIIERHWGLTGASETLQEIGDGLDLTRERIRQIEARGLARMGVYRTRRPSPSLRSVEAPP